MNNPMNWTDPLGVARGDWWDPRTYISTSYHMGIGIEGRSISNGIEQQTLSFVNLIGVSFDIHIGCLPTARDAVGEIGFGLGDYLGLGFFFARPDSMGGFDVGGLVLHLGIGVGSPVHLSATMPEGETVNVYGL